MARDAGYALYIMDTFSWDSLPHGHRRLCDPQFGGDSRDHAAPSAYQGHIAHEGISARLIFCVNGFISGTYGIYRQYAGMGIGAVIREARKRAGLKQEDLANAIGNPQSYISQLENDKTGAELSTRIKLSEVLKIPISQLLPELGGHGGDDAQALELMRDYLKLSPSMRLAVLLHVKALADTLKGQK